MALVTYILLSTVLAGLRGAFHPELLGLTATTAFAVVLLEILGLKLGTYLLSISSESQLLDLVAYSGYKFVGIIVTLLLSEILNRTNLGGGGGGTGGWVGWIIFLYVFSANAFFLLRSLRYVLLPDAGPSSGSAASYTVARSQRNRRTQFLFVYSYVVQFVFMWLLSRQSADPKAVKV
jgi:protein transport protein YIF1